VHNATTQQSEMLRVSRYSVDTNVMIGRMGDSRPLQSPLSREGVAIDVVAPHKRLRSEPHGPYDADEPCGKRRNHRSERFDGSSGIYVRE
jgi:hypothetical protein